MEMGPWATTDTLGDWHDGLTYSVFVMLFFKCQRAELVRNIYYACNTMRHFVATTVTT